MMFVEIYAEVSYYSPCRAGVRHKVRGRLSGVLDLCHVNQTPDT